MMKRQLKKFDNQKGTKIKMLESFFLHTLMSSIVGVTLIILFGKILT